MIEVTLNIAEEGFSALLEAIEKEIIQLRMVRGAIVSESRQHWMERRLKHLEELFNQLGEAKSEQIPI